MLFLILNTFSERRFPSERSLLPAVTVRVTVPQHTPSRRRKFGIPGLEPLCYTFEDFLIMLTSKKNIFDLNTRSAYLLDFENCHVLSC